MEAGAYEVLFLLLEEVDHGIHLLLPSSSYFLLLFLLSFLTTSQGEVDYGIQARRPGRILEIIQIDLIQPRGFIAYAQYLRRSPKAKAHEAPR